jgi:hypothetical protein
MSVRPFDNREVRAFETSAMCGQEQPCCIIDTAGPTFGPIPIFQWPMAWALICLLLAVDFVWASQVGLTIGGG